MSSLTWISVASVKGTSMPTRWFVAIPGLIPERVKLEHVHAAVSGWFDTSIPEHRAGEKPYAVSPPTRDQHGITGVEVVTLTDEATRRLTTATAGHPEVRLGNQCRRLGGMRRLCADEWAELAQPCSTTEWRLELVTPTTFRTGNRSSPLPTVEGLVRGARAAWAAWSPVSLPEGDGSSLWVSDVDLRSDIVPLTIRGADGRSREILISAVTGSLVVRHGPTDHTAAALVRTASYTGVGAMTLKGLGVTRVGPARGRRAHAS